VDTKNFQTSVRKVAASGFSFIYYRLVRADPTFHLWHSSPGRRRPKTQRLREREGADRESSLDPDLVPRVVPRATDPITNNGLEHQPTSKETVGYSNRRFVHAKAMESADRG
jgi:hypothetical protein